MPLMCDHSASLVFRLRDQHLLSGVIGLITMQGVVVV